MNQDVMFFVIASLIVVALAVIGPGLVVWQYQRGGTSAVRGKRPASLPMVGQSDDGPSTTHRETSN